LLFFNVALSEFVQKPI